MKTVLKILLFFSFIFLFSDKVAAHQPYLVEQSQRVDIVDPEISKAYYGEMPGKPVFYYLESDKPFNLYVSILVPKLDGIETDYVIEIFRDKTFLKRLDGKKLVWKEYYEKFGGDYYFMGPEYEIEALPGKYSLIITSKDNFGKYALTVGKKEVFDGKEILRTLSVMPALKRDFFEYSWIKLIMGRIGLIYAFPLIILSITVLVLLRKINSPKKKRKK